MGLFNKLFGKQKTAPTVINQAGGQAYDESNELKLASLLLTSFANDQFYRSANQTFQDIIQLLPKVDAQFAAKAAIYARNEFGMRSITHVLAAELAAHISGKAWAKAFYDKIVYRPDDMLEILAYFRAKGGKHLPNAIKKGFAKAFDKFDGYQIAKYRGENSAVKLVDVVNLVHPTPTNRNAKALTDLIKGTLRNTETWESKLTQAGQKAENEENKAELKREAWGDLLRTNKLGYFALLRNLRNIAEQAPELIGEVCALLTNKEAIKRSLVLPFRFLTAMDAVNEIQQFVNVKRALVAALNTAIDLSLSNVPTFDGRTLIVLDDSGSMTSGKVRDMNRTPIQIGALFAAVLYKSNNADLMAFSDDARYLNFNIGDASQSISERLIAQAKSGGTNFHAIFQKANKAYDRIVILSDMQGWVGYAPPTADVQNYEKKYNAKPYIYSFDLQGLGSLQFPQDRVFALAGFSEKVFDLMKLLETDRNAIVNTIRKIEL